ncbi:Uncharacterised protein [Vibrio cholerae]|nr:Uncharacterised protein [Vibrio cholerae]
MAACRNLVSTEIHETSCGTLKTWRSMRRIRNR